MPVFIQVTPPLPDFVDSPLDESINTFLLIGRREASAGPYGLNAVPNLITAMAFPAWVLDTQDVRFVEHGSFKLIQPPKLHIINPTTQLLTDINQAIGNLKIEKLNKLRERHGLGPKPMSHSTISELIADLPRLNAGTVELVCRNCERLIAWRYDEYNLYACVFCVDSSKFASDLRQIADETSTSLIFLESAPPSW